MSRSPCQRLGCLIESRVSSSVCLLAKDASSHNGNTGNIKREGGKRKGVGFAVTQGRNQKVSIASHISWLEQGAQGAGLSRQLGAIYVPASQKGEAGVKIVSWLRLGASSRGGLVASGAPIRVHM